jgi:hypothetical protein
VATRTHVQTRTREPLPPSLTRDWDGIVPSRNRGAANERPPSIKDAIIRWLNEEL